MFNQCLGKLRKENENFVSLRNSLLLKLISGGLDVSDFLYDIR